MACSGYCEGLWLRFRRPIVTTDNGHVTDKTVIIGVYPQMNNLRSYTFSPGVLPRRTNQLADDGPP